MLFTVEDRTYRHAPVLMTTGCIWMGNDSSAQRSLIEVDDSVLVIIDIQDSVVADCHPMGILTQIFAYMLRI